MASTQPQLIGLAVSGYRSLRSVQVLAPLGKVTLLAGRNNAGKSNILRFIAAQLASPVAVEWGDAPQPEGEGLKLFVAFDRAPITIPGGSISPEYWNTFLNILFNLPSLHPFGDDGKVWIEYSPHDNSYWSMPKDFVAAIFTDISNLEVNFGQMAASLSRELTGTHGGEQADDLGRVLAALFEFRPPEVAVIDAFRQIVPGDSSASSNDHSGRSLVARLAHMQQPSANSSYEAERAKFDAINDFARYVFEDSQVSIEVPASQDGINVRQAGRILPLANYGTGLHQVIILAAAATTLDSTLVCIEEPEVHLHPLLQRKLVRYLLEHTSNQYVIATHSAHMLDYGRASVLHVRYRPEVGTTTTAARSYQDVSDICGDLGYRPSDLIQTNSVIWVEGPSDRVYVLHWLAMIAPDEFIEGLDFSIMFYGGGLLNHLTAEDPTIAEFISLRRLNRHSMILIDSDKKSASSRINSTKSRVRDEFNDSGMPGFAWITDGYTIENLVPTEILKGAVKLVHPQLFHEYSASKWDPPLSLLSKTKRGADGTARKPAAPDKIKIARSVCELWSDPAQLGQHTRENLLRLATFVRTANAN